MNFEKIKTMDCFNGRLSRLREEYDSFVKEPLPELTKEAFDCFYETGSRKEYEVLYFKRRNVLLDAALISFIYGEGIDFLISVMKEICYEPTWALPAHMDQNSPEPEREIDLFAAETAHALSEICYILGDKLPDSIRETVRHELMRRTILPFEEKTFFWEDTDCNWASVCAGSVGITFMYMFPERFKNVEKRFLKTMEAYLSGFGDDGISPEGLGYWNYGFWYFTGFADLYKQKYGVDIMNTEKIKNIAMCQQNLFLRKNIIASYSDCGRTEHFNAALAHYYRNKFGSDIRILSTEIPDGVDNCYRFLIAVRSLLWIDEKYLGIKEESFPESYFKDCSWYVNRHKKFAFSAKGGNNGESHNHNDIGSFIIADDSGQLLADYGAGEYTRDYFSEKRYEYLCTSSRGHSVPVIDGIYQHEGIEFRSELLKAGDGIFELNIAKAYAADNLSELIRRFEITDNSVILEDKFSFTDNKKHDITERFVSVIKPEIRNGKAVIGNLTLECAYTPEIYSEELPSHNTKKNVLYFIDFKSDSHFKIEFKYS